MLTPSQLRVANRLYTLARQAGLPPARASEFVAASYAESGLNPRAVNKSSGAAGAYQLLSKGYVDRANAGGGVFNLDANAKAILPDYKAYWAGHPNAAPGDAGRDVERSGEGSSFYSSPLAKLGKLGTGAAPVGSSTADLPIPAAGSVDHGTPLKQFALDLIHQSQNLSHGLPSDTTEAVMNFHDANAQQAAEPMPTPDQPGIPGLADDGGHVVVGPSANRGGVTINKPVLQFVKRISSIYGAPLTIGTGTNHNEYVVGTHRESDHWQGNAADIPATGAQLTRMGQDALIAAGMPEAEARKQTGGVYNLELGGHRVQILFNTKVGGNHFNHLHVGVR